MTTKVTNAVCVLTVAIMIFLVFNLRTPSLNELTNVSLGSLISVNTKSGKVDLVVYPNYIYINPFETEKEFSFNGDTITADNYPSLFSQGKANQSFVSAMSLVKSRTEYIQISNNQPDHGGYSTTYSLYLDVNTGQITDSIEE